MTFIDAVNTGKVAVYDGLVGGYVLIDGNLYFIINILDIIDPQWVKDNLTPIYDNFSLIFKTGMPLSFFLSNDWKVL